LLLQLNYKDVKTFFLFRLLVTIKSMNNASKDDELPFLELNEEIPAQWAIDAESPPQKMPQHDAYSTHQVPPPARPLGDGTPARYSPFQSVRTQYGLTPTAKMIIGVGAVLVLLMITFRVPPGLVLIGLFSVLRVLFFPLAIVGFVLWAWRYRR
jgi:hypothetical protein